MYSDSNKTRTRKEAMMLTATLDVDDLEFVPSRTYAAFHGCGATIIGEGEEMRDAMKDHTSGCEWMEPTA